LWSDFNTGRCKEAQTLQSPDQSCGLEQAHEVAIKPLSYI